MLERLKELETTQNYSEMLNELRRHESITTQAYARIGSLITNPAIAGILKALEEISVSTTSLLRHCSDLLEDETIATPLAAEADVSSTISVSVEATRDRDNMFSLDNLQTMLSETPPKEISEEETPISATFWYIKGGQNESIELTLPEREIFAKIIFDILKQIGVESKEKFSISPLGFEELLRHQLQNSFGQIVKTYGEEFTLIKLYT
ncbi:MAG: hypothetical protein ACFFFH_10980 [Candidatus Thorarchaeota archaeon]